MPLPYNFSSLFNISLISIISSYHMYINIIHNMNYPNKNVLKEYSAYDRWAPNGMLSELNRPIFFTVIFLLTLCKELDDGETALYYFLPVQIPILDCFAGSSILSDKWRSSRDVTVELSPWRCWQESIFRLKRDWSVNGGAQVWDRCESRLEFRPVYNCNANSLRDQRKWRRILCSDEDSNNDGYNKCSCLCKWRAHEDKAEFFP